MRDKINNILLGTLWLMVAALGACFWFNSQFGFNIFSTSHWKYLGYMQAAQNPVTPLFYISMIIAIFLTIYVLYLLLRPRIRKIPIPHRYTVHSNYTKNPEKTTTPAATKSPSTIQPPISVSVVSVPQPTKSESAPALQTQQIPEINLSRPPRLNLSVTPILHPTPVVQATPTHTPKTPQKTETNDWPQLREIFESAGYVIKPTPRIGGVQTSLFAIGINETIWIGAVGIKTSTLQSALDIINQVFADTLDDIIINVNGFVLSAPDSANPESPNILTFDTPSSLDKYMHEHENPPIPSDDDGNFDAFSSYISTVIEYLGKM
ncbi:MAG: hypothetical protein IKW57_03205 [Alphaproteobacteria bacterium]|nr:hypothetical protein [Alphaproteobacteria bacterium]